jgi:signal transduction histidine kinase
MPGLKGPEIIKKIRKQVTNRYIYTILLTSKGSIEDRTEGFDSGVDSYLTKPIELHSIISTLNVAVRIIQYEIEKSQFTLKMKEYAQEMKELADERAMQLINAERVVLLGTFSAGISHEIVNPLSFINLNAQMIRKKLDLFKTEINNSINVNECKKHSEELLNHINEMINSIFNGTSRINTIANDLKTFSRHGKIDREEIFDPVEAMKNSLKLCRHILNRSIKINKNITETQKRVKGNQRLIEQVLVNLITNAFQAVENLPNGEITIAVEEYKHGVEFSVKDNGSGIIKENLEKIFKPFFTTKRENEGTGLGLSICKTIIEKHNSTLLAKNNPDNGASFSFILTYV